MNNKSNILAKVMDAVKGQATNRNLIIGLVIGLLLGLLFAWGIWPVQYVDALPDNLQDSVRQDYLRMVIESYGLTSDEGLADARLVWMGDTVKTHFDEISGDFSFEEFGKFRVRVETGEFPLDGAVEPEAEGETEGEPAEDEGSSLLSTVLKLAVGFLLLAAVGFGAYFFLFKRKRAPRAFEDEVDLPFAAEVPAADADYLGEAPPLAQWMTTFTIGDDLFDDSFSIDAPTGEFLGECGVGIADTIGVGDPKKVSAFEIWLFDKNDIQTVTKVLMSKHGYMDDATRERLAAKGEPLPVELGSELVLETETLQMVARVVDMSYGEGALPEESFFDRMTIELAVWTKN